MHRRPQTQAVRRASQQRGNHQIIDGYQVHMRARRNSKNIPNAWDDIMRPWNVRSWKNHRKTQWK